MARKRETTVIGGFNYDVGQVGGKLASATTFRLGKMLAPMFAAGSPQIGAIMASLRHADQEDFEYWRDTMLSEINIVRTLDNGDGKTNAMPQKLSACWDEHFAGRTGDLYKLLVFATRLNFADFFSAWQEAAEEFAAKQKEAAEKMNASPPLPASAGSSGDS